MKKKPQTIADLKINWTFEDKYVPYEDQIGNFNKLNPKLTEIKIKLGRYFFHWNTCSIDLIEGKTCKLNEFIWDLGYKLRTEIESYFTLVRVLKKPLRLDYFEFLSENTFKIHEKE
jgi:hypothetical protein